MRKVTLLAALLLLAPAVSQAKSLEDLLVEKGVITRGEAAGSVGGGASKVYWDKGTKVEFPDSGFTFGINTFIQTRYTFTDGDEDAGASNSSSFSVNKARIIVQGTALHEEFSYYLSGDFVGESSEGEKVTSLKDAYLTWHACDWIDVKMGQFKTAISRQFNTSDQSLQFADRSVASDFFDLGRQVGAVAKTSLADGLIDVSAGIFNGDSDGEGVNRGGVDTKHTGIISVRGNVMGKVDPKEEGDVGNTEEPGLSVGATYAYADGEQTAFGGDVTSDNLSVDVNFKYAGWSVNAEYFYANRDADAGGDSIEPQGFYIQGGYFIDPKTLEVALRYAFIDCDDGLASPSGPASRGVKQYCTGNDNVNEVTAGVNYYWWAHHLKAQANYVFLSENPVGAGGSDNDNNTGRWLVQLSAYL